MPSIELTDATYRAAVERSAANGFSTVSDYIADVVMHDAADPADAGTPDLDYLFTAERMAHIAAGEADVAAGRVYTSAEVDAHFAKRRADWAKGL